MRYTCDEPAPPATAGVERMLGLVGLLAIGLIGVAADHLGDDGMPNAKSSPAMVRMLALALVAGVTAVGWVLDVRIAERRFQIAD